VGTKFVAKNFLGNFGGISGKIKCIPPKTLPAPTLMRSHDLISLVPQQQQKLKYTVITDIYVALNNRRI